MNILVFLAVAAALGFLRFSRASLLLWAGVWWVGIYVLLRFGFIAPIPSSVVSIYMGIVSVAILAYVTSSQERRGYVCEPRPHAVTVRVPSKSKRKRTSRRPDARSAWRKRALSAA